MILFWLTCLSLVAMTVAFLFLPLRPHGHSAAAAGTTADANVEVYRDQLAELESDLRQQRVTPEQLAREREELELRLAVDLRTGSSTSGTRAHADGPPATLWWLAIVVSLAAVLLYVAIGGSPASISPAR